MMKTVLSFSSQSSFPKYWKQPTLWASGNYRQAGQDELTLDGNTSEYEVQPHALLYKAYHGIYITQGDYHGWNPEMEDEIYDLLYHSLLCNCQ